MSSLAIIGLQWGDEGKGKITDLLGGDCDGVVRFQGGHNAGHTIWVDGKKTVLHLIPSGILHPSSVVFIAHGVAFDPRAFLDEIMLLGRKGLNIDPEKIRVSQNCPVVTRFHHLLDQVRESGPWKLGTTGKGIGPCYEDKIARSGMRLKDLLNYDVLLDKIQKSLSEKRILFEKLYKLPIPQAEEEARDLFELGKDIRPFLCDTLEELAGKGDKKILYEGAQGVLLDVDYGTYPYVTSSHTFYGGIQTGAFPGLCPGEVIGVAKAYSTRVGEGPFPTELNDSTGEVLQKLGHEYGSTTGRMRRCGWPDLPLLKYAVSISGATSMALTKLDVLAQMKQLKYCRAYLYEGKEIDCPFMGMDLSKVSPVYEEIPLFSGDFSGTRLDDSLKNFIKVIEDFTGIPVGMISYGPERNQIRFLRDY